MKKAHEDKELTATRQTKTSYGVDNLLLMTCILPAVLALI